MVVPFLVRLRVDAALLVPAMPDFSNARSDQYSLPALGDGGLWEDW